MTAKRPDDRSGRNSLQVLHLLRERLATELDTVYGPALVLCWATETSDAEDEPKRSANARFNGLRLLVVEMGKASLTDEPLFVPQVNWCLGCKPKPDDVRVGGPAPTLDDTKARAELALRVHVRTGIDS